MSDSTSAFGRLESIIRRLRDPGGCPWDQKQTPSSLKAFLLEEVYECFEAIDEAEDSHVREELGDIFMILVMISYMKEQENVFNVADVLEEVCEKLVRRHPHVFGGVQLETTDEVMRQWVDIKDRVEGRHEDEKSVLDKVVKSMPPLERASRLQARAAAAGFDWDRIDDVRTKVREELDELDEAVGRIARTDGAAKEEVETEFGDVLFSLINLSRFLGVDPTLALHRTNAKFVKRFSFVEREMRIRDKKMSKENLQEMDALWNAAKETVEKQRR